MIVSELLEPVPDRIWSLVRQAGVDNAVVLLEGAEQQTRWMASVTGDTGAAKPVAPRGSRPWDLEAIQGLQRRYADHGFAVSAIEDTAPMDRIRLGARGRDEEIEFVIDQIEAMGRCGIPVLCYNWMALTSWARTATDVPARGGALTTAYDASVARDWPALVEPGSVPEAQLWEALEYFLRAVVPVAEQAGVRLGLHPDDPPVAAVRGVPRIIRSVDAYRRVMDLVPSTSNAVTLCQGNWALMTDDLPAVIHEFGRANRVAFVHFRDVRGTADNFVETFHGEGQTDMAACMRAYKEVGFNGPLRPDHVQTLHGEDNAKPGYGALGRLYAFGYIAGMHEAVYGPHRACDRAQPA